MTVIAWDGTTLAADKRATAGSVHYTVTKIIRLDDNTLVGISGHLGHGLAVCEWLKAGRDKEKFPRMEDPSEKSFCLVVHRSGLLERFEGEPFPLVIEERIQAFGSGRDFAAAAMHLGHNAHTAVMTACALSTDCGNGIDMLSFERIH